MWAPLMFRSKNLQLPKLKIIFIIFIFALFRQHFLVLFVSKQYWGKKVSSFASISSVCNYLGNYFCFCLHWSQNVSSTFSLFSRLTVIWNSGSSFSSEIVINQKINLFCLLTYIKVNKIDNLKKSGFTLISCQTWTLD